MRQFESIDPENIENDPRVVSQIVSPEDSERTYYLLIDGDLRIPDESGHGSDGKASTVPTRIRPPFRFDSGHHSGAIRPV